MNEVTPMILQELIDKIEVHAVEGTGLNRTQSVIMHYKFIGELDMTENFDKIKVSTRKGVEVEYLRTTKRLKNKKSSVHNFIHVMNTRYGRGDRI